LKVLQLIWGLWKWILGSFQILYIYVYGGIELYYRYLIISPMREPIGWLNGYHLTIDYLMYLFVFYHAHVHYYFHS
jgi:hypothetical protein